jgi:hypothetical protein
MVLSYMKEHRDNFTFYQMDGQTYRPMKLAKRALKKES